jgi:hypothetical protein
MHAIDVATYTRKKQVYMRANQYTGHGGNKVMANLILGNRLSSCSDHVVHLRILVIINDWQVIMV